MLTQYVRHHGRFWLALHSTAPEHCLDPGHQFSGTEWLGDVVISSQFKPHNPVDFITHGAEKYHRRLGFLADDPAEIRTVTFRHHDIKQYQIRLFSTKSCQRLVAVLCRYDLETAFLQGKSGHLENIGVIINQEYQFVICHNLLLYRHFLEGTQRSGMMQVPLHKICINFP